MTGKVGFLCCTVLACAALISAQSLSSPGATQDKPARLFPFWNETYLHGYSDAQGRIIITPQFLTAQDFSEGLARVEVCTDYGAMEGFIDASGKFVISPKFDWAGDFSEGLAQIVINNKWGFIDKNGVVVVQPRFEADILEHFKFSKGFAAVKVGEKWGYIDKVGEFLVKPKFDHADSFSEGMAEVWIKHKRGYIDTTGRIVIKPRFDLAAEFSEGLARVNIGYTHGRNSTDPGYRSGKWGYIDRLGTMVIEPQFEYADSFYQGRALVRVDGMYGFMNKSAQLVIDLKYQDAHQFSEGLAAVRLDGKWGYIDLDGKTVIPFQFGPARSFSDGFAVVNNFKNRINRNGEIVWSVRPWTSYSRANCEAKIGPPPSTPEEIARRRKEIHSLMLEGRYQHDGSGELYYIGNITSVPSLLRVLKDHTPKSDSGPVICTYGHAVGALRKITGHIATSYEDWRAWWDLYQKSHGKELTK